MEFKLNEPVTKILQEPEFKYKENVLFVETKYVIIITTVHVKANKVT